MLDYFNNRKTRYKANFDFFSFNKRKTHIQQTLIFFKVQTLLVVVKIMNHCVFIRNTNTIDYLKTFNLKDLRRVFNKMIYKELMKMGEKFANSYPMTKTKKIIMFL